MEAMNVTYWMWLIMCIVEECGGNLLDWWGW